MTSRPGSRPGTIALAVGVLSCGAPSPPAPTHPPPPAVTLPEPSATLPEAGAPVAVPSAENRLDAMITEGWKQRSAGDPAAAQSSFARARATLPQGATLEPARAFLRIEAPDGVDHVVARGDLLVMHGGSGPSEASVLVDPTSGEVLRWFGRAQALAAGKDHALLRRDGDVEKHTDELTSVDLRTGAESVPVVISTMGSIGWPRGVTVSTGGSSVAFTAEDGSSVIHFLRDWSDAWSTGPADPDKSDPGETSVDLSPDGKVAFVVPELVSARGPQPQSANLMAVDGDTTYSAEMPEPGADPFNPGGIPPSQPDPVHAFSPDSRYVLVEARKKGGFELLDATTGSVLGSSKACASGTVVAFAADARHVVVVQIQTVTRARVCAFEVPTMRVTARATWSGEPSWLVAFGRRMLADPIGVGALVFDPATLKTVTSTHGNVKMIGPQRALVNRSCDAKAPKPPPDCGALVEVTPDGSRLLRSFPRDAPVQPEVAALPERAGDRLCHAGRWVFPLEACGPPTSAGSTP
jgi:hypothetical protein